MINRWTYAYDADLDEYQIIDGKNSVCFIDFQLNNPEKTEQLNLITAAPIMLDVLKECHKAIISDYNIPSTLPKRLKDTIALATVGTAE